MKRIVVVGGGPAGLAAAERLLHEGRGQVEVTLYTDKSYVGGKAASWDLGGGLVAENGQHVFMGFYRELPALIGRAGVEVSQTSVSNKGHLLFWEDRDQRTHHLHFSPSPVQTFIEGLRYSGWTLAEKAGFAFFMARVTPTVLKGVPEAWDDECLTAWCLERGLPRSCMETNLFRATRDAQLNWPNEISAYGLLKIIQRAGRDWTTGEARFPGGGMSRIWWEPIARRVESLGGRIVRGRKLVGLGHRDGRLAHLVLGRSTCPGHDDERPRCHEGEEVIRGFDAAIIAIPPLAFHEALGRTPELREIPAFAGAGRLVPTVPLGLHVWHRNATHPPYPTVVAGIAPPLEFVVDNKPFYEEYRNNASIGAALHFVGQETGFEDLGDEALLMRAMAATQRITGFEGMDPEGILAWHVVRNREPHQRYWNSEPGSLRNRPWPKTPLQGLWLAGDWIRSEMDFPCMESAVFSGRATAGLVMDDLLGAPDIAGVASR